MTHSIFDAAIVGGGPVGAALAIALARGGLSVTVIDGREPTLPSNGQWDARVYAVSPGSRDFLDGLNAWHRIPADRIAPITGMQVWGDDGKANIEFDALDGGRDDLGCIAEASRIQMALWDTLRNEPAIMLNSSAACESFDINAGQVRLKLTNGNEIAADLLIGADGADSWVRRNAGLAADSKSYGQIGVVANFTTEFPHKGIARQWFRNDGVIAWLPLPGNRMSIVWSAQTPIAKSLLALDADTFCERVAAAGNHALGRLELIAPPASFPLRLVDLPSTVRPSIALVGDAAHVVHPLAGQGVNLGLRDANTLAQVLLNRNRHEALGNIALLRRYERARREDWLATKWVTDGLHTLFHPDRQHLAAMRNWGLAFTNRLDGLKRRFISHAVQ